MTDGLASGGRGRLVATVGAATALLLVPLVAKWEGKRNSPYLDAVGVLTVCYGDTKVPMRRYSDAQCSALLEYRLADYALPVLERNPELRGYPYQLAPATSLAYNLGPGPSDLRLCGRRGVKGGYRCSWVARHFAAGNWRAACDAFLRYDFAGTIRLPGLTKRRHEERAICLKGLS